MDVQNLKSRSRKRFLSRAPALLIVMLLPANLLEAQTPSPVPPERMLYSVKEKEMSFNTHIDGKSGSALTSHQTHYVVRFKENENFEFYIAGEFAHPSFSTFMNKGFTVYYYNEGRDFLPISNRLLMYRQALLAAEQYFAQVARTAGLPLNFMYEEPIRVVVGTPTDDDAAAQACFSHNWICFGSMYYLSQGIAVHEYFHFVQDAVWYRDKTHYARQTEELAEEPFDKFLEDMTADWATDEPITVAASPGYPEINIDTTQKYLDEKGDRYITEVDRGFFDTSQDKFRRYKANLLIKYWAEQMAGQQDKSGAGDLLKALRRIHELGGENATGFFLGLTEPLPPQFDGPGEEFRWRNFFRSFCASNVVQKAKLMGNSNTHLGYHDEAFRHGSYKNKLQKRYRSDSRVAPKKVWREPAADDEERRERLKTLCDAADEIAPLAQKLYLIDLEDPTTTGRPVFLYAAGEPGTGLYLLRHNSLFNDFKDRNYGSIKLLSEVSFTDRSAPPVSETVAVVDRVDFNEHSDYLWLGLVNSATELKARTAKWTYLASPRLITDHRKVTGSDTETVQLVGGSARRRWEVGLVEFFGGDDFTVRIETTGPLHHSSADLNDLKRDDVALDFKALDKSGNEIPLDLVAGTRLKIKAKPSDRHKNCWFYFLSGKIPADTLVQGRCRFRIRLTSPLNLGLKDEQIDQDFEFSLTPVNPFLFRLEAMQGQQHIYDNVEHVRFPPQENNGSYTMTIFASFSRDMDHAKTRITAGTSEPYHQYRVEPTEWLAASIFQGRLVVPKADVPAGGMLLRFSVSGTSEKDPNVPVGHIDTDLVKEGHQPDTSHFILIGPTEYWQVSQSSRANKYVEDVGANLRVMGYWGPARGTTQLIPYMAENAEQRFILQNSQRRLAVLESIITLAEDSVKQLDQEYRQVSNPAAKQPQAVIQFRKDALLRQKRLLGFLRLRLKPMLEAVVRINSGYRTLHRDSARCEPLEVAFEGMHIHWHPVTREHSLVKEGRIIGWSNGTYDAYGDGWAQDAWFPTSVKVWDFWPSDIRKLKQLMYLAGNYPAYITDKVPDGPKASPTDALRRGVYQQLNPFLNQELPYELSDLSLRMWSFFPPAARPVDDSVYGDIEKIRATQAQWTQLPDPKTSRLIQILDGNLIPAFDVPVKFNSESYWQERASGTTEPGEHVNENSPERYSESEWWPAGDIVQHKDTERAAQTEGWDGIIPPVRPLRTFNLHPPAEPFLDVDFDKWDRDINWSLSGELTHVEAHIASERASLFLQPQTEDAVATLRGSHLKWERERKNGVLNWTTEWRMKRIGNPPQPDPKEPLPKWDKTLGDPPPLEDSRESSGQGGRSASDPSSPDDEKHRSTSKEDQNKPKTPPNPAKKKSPESASATSFDPTTGITTISQKNPDGSRTVTSVDSTGKVRSHETETEADRQRTYGSQYDPDTGETTTVVGNDDGSRTITVTDREGNVKAKRTVSEAERKRPGASIRDPETGNTVTSERLADGRVRITRRNAAGREIEPPTYRPPE